MKLYVRSSKFLFCGLKFFVSLSEIKISKTSHVALNINEMFMEARNAFYIGYLIINQQCPFLNGDDQQDWVYDWA